MAGKDMDIYLEDDFILYGAGYCGLMFLDLLDDYGRAPLCVFDTDMKKIGKKIHNNVYVKNPFLENSINKKINIIVCLLQKDGLFIEIKNKLRLLGYTNVHHIYEYRENEKLFQNQNLVIAVDNNLVKRHMQDIDYVYNYLSDKLSQDTYKALFEFLEKDYDVKIPHFPMKEQYFSYDCYKKIDTEVFVDCGAFVGEILDYFIENNADEFCAYYAFEPDKRNALRIKVKEGENRVRIIHKALSDRKEELLIKNYGNYNSVISPKGDMRIESIELDDYKFEFKPTFIKIDVEGFEQRALRGMKNLICNDKPCLAVAIYHKVEDLWKIPQMLRAWLPYHKMYVRSYMNLQETILYVIAPERAVIGEQNEVFSR